MSANATAKALNFLDSLTGPVARRADELALFPRIDWQSGARTSIAVEWARVRFRSPSGQRSTPVVARGRASFGDLTTHTDSVLLHGSMALSPRWLGGVRAQWSRDAAFAEIPAPLAGEPHTGLAGAAPEVSIASAFTFGNPAALGSRRLPEERRTEAATDVAFNGQAHTISMGADVSFVDDRVGSRGASSGAYDYTSGTTQRTCGRSGGLHHGLHLLRDQLPQRRLSVDLRSGTPILLPQLYADVWIGAGDSLPHDRAKCLCR